MAVDDTRSGTATAEPPSHEQAEHEAEVGTGASEHGAGGGIHLPPESLWPITLAFGVTIMMLGLVTNLLVSLPGLLLFVVALRGWTQELLYGKH